VLVWHYHDDDVPGPDAAVELALTGLPVKEGAARLTHYRIDDRHSNAYAEWQRLGSPPAPDRVQYNQLVSASELATLETAPASVAVKDGAAALKFSLPRQAVSLLVLEWE
jgi:xylan 1,4-beta-xylosidase